VFSAGRTQQMLQSGGTGGGGQPLVVQLVVNDRVVQEVMIAAERMRGGAR
jgi:hypothetical protein